MKIVKFNLKDKNELFELDKECLGVNHWDKGVFEDALRYHLSTIND